VNRPLRIAHFVYDHPGNVWIGGGGSYRAVAVNRVLSQRGHDIHMVCGRHPTVGPTESEHGYTVHYKGTPRSYLASRATYGLTARQVLSGQSFDLLVDDTSAYTFSMPYLVSSAPRLAIVHHLFGRHVFGKNGPLGIIPFLFEKLNLKAYRHFLVGSASVREQIRRMRPGAIIAHIPYGVEDVLFEATPRDGEYLLYVGRIDIYNKGLDTLLKAFSLARANLPDLRLVVAGGGKDERAFAAMVAESTDRDSIEYRGRVSEQEKRALIEGAHCVCMPSRYEGWGIVAIESAACHKPVLGCDIPGLSDAVVNGETGILVARDDVAALAQGMERLATNRTLAQTLGEAGAKRAAEFRWDKIAISQEQFYYSVLADWPRRAAR
jgi:glycosyltransferase involved in cell wall biosynthesis